jgi:hypothetical protein
MPRREAEEDLTEHVLVERQGFGIRRRFAAAATAAAVHPDAIPGRVDLGMEARAPAEGHSGYLLTGADLGMEARAATAGHLLAADGGSFVGGRVHDVDFLLQLLI